MAILEESVGDIKKNSVFVTLDDSHSSVASSNSSEIVHSPTVTKILNLNNIT